MRPASSVAPSIDPADIRSELARILLRHSDFPDAIEAGGDATLLLDGGLALTSIGLLNAILELEDAFGIRLREEDFLDGAVATVGGLVEHVRAKLPPRSLE